ncbi:hypothetical protein [Kangiella spongicola]|nr:hypothetical protein [Kangiella spongicola]
MMNTTTKLKQATFAFVAMMALGLSANLQADQPTEPLENVKLFGVVNTLDSERNLITLQPQASTIKEERFDGLTVLTLSQSFSNTSDSALSGYYQIPLPNPSALIHYEVSSDGAINELSDPQKVSLEKGQSITYTVRYELHSDLLVGFHQAHEPMFEDANLDVETAIAQN